MIKLNIYRDKFQRSPDCITNHDYRFYALLKIVCTIGLLTHASWIFLFYFLEVPALSYFNIASVVIFSLAFYFNQKGKFFVSTAIGMLEVIAHQLFCSYYIGVDAGFQYYILIACMLPFLLPKGHNWLKGILLIIGMAAFIYIVYYVKYETPKNILDDSIILFLGYSNLIFAFSFLGIWGMYFSKAILSTEFELENKNKAIKSSINYSEKIQRSILPQMDVIKKDFPNSFVLFEPKDIIGGDFYWYFKRGDHCFIAAIDCTGHGVPGALLSMTIHSLLNGIMMKEMLKEPAEILSLLHQKVNRALQQQKGDAYSQDGCDVSLIRVDLKNNELVFSGAFNNLYVYDGEQLKILKADKQSIGGLSMLGEFEITRIFNSQTITLTKIDMVILTTDGILDQLDQNDESFGLKEFERVVKNMYGNNSDDMRNLIVSSVMDWKSNVQQQDDLLMFGFRANS